MSKPTPEWRDISSAPRDGTRVLLWPFTEGYRLRGKWYVGMAYWHQPTNSDVSGFWVGGLGKVERPTHWMPLPAPPEEIEN